MRFQNYVVLTILLAGFSGWSTREGLAQPVARESSDPATWTEPPSPATPSDEALAQMRAGAIVIRDARADEAGGAAVAMAIYHIEPSRLWRLIGDCEANRRFVRGLLACEVSKESATSAVTRQRLKPYALFPALEYRFETLREPYRWIRIRLLDGDLRALAGSWRLDPLGGTELLVTHEIRVQPAYPAPRWLARRTVKKDLAELMACLRWEARAWPDPRQLGEDRQACPQ